MGSNSRDAGPRSRSGRIRTIVYLLSRPVPRPAILGEKLAAYLAAVLGVAWPSLVLGFFLSATPADGGGASALLRALAAAGVALSAYGALFTFLGLILRKPWSPAC